MVKYSNCPVCNDPSIHLLFPVKDHSVAGEWFQLWECVRCLGRFTQDAPGITEIGKYYASEEYISHSDTKKGLVNRLYHTVRNITVKHKRKLVMKATGRQHGEVLDIGCGTGSFLASMRSIGWKVTGIEPDGQARSNAGRVHDIVPLPADALFSLPEGSFNAITLWHVLEHVHDLHGYLKKIGSLLASRGKIFIAVPNHTSFDAHHYREYWAAYDVPRHLYHFSPTSMNALMKAHGLQVEEIKPMWFDSFYVSLLSEKYRKGFAGFIKACIIGALSNLNTLFRKEKCSSLIYVVRKA